MNDIELIKRDIKQIKLHNQLIDDVVMDVPAVASFMHCSVDVVYKNINHGILPMRKKAGGFRIMKSKLIEYINND